MKTLYVTLILTVMAFAQVEVALGRDHGPNFDHIQQKSTYQPEIVQWTGIIHSLLDNEVELEFVRNEDKTKYDIIDSPELESFDWANHESRLVKIEAERTPRFLFWGGNLIVKSFQILEETGVYEMPKQVANRTLRELHDRR